MRNSCINSLSPTVADTIEGLAPKVQLSITGPVTGLQSNTGLPIVSIIVPESNLAQYSMRFTVAAFDWVSNNLVTWFDQN